MRGTAAPAREAAPAKLNLSLRVTGRRSDGYHLIDSLVVFADIGDRLSAAPADALSLTITGPMAGALVGPDGAAGGDNLVLRAAAALRAHLDIAAGAALTLEKHLPVAAGLGGGSADAAATLRALCRLWDVDPGGDALAALALDLGADVPVCLAGRPARMTGIGEVLTPLPPLPDDPPAGVLIANPRAATPTGAVFRALTSDGDFVPAPAPPERLGPGAPDLARAVARLGNDLTAPAIRITPAIESVLARLAALPGAHVAALSGSGASCFALFDDESLAGAAALRLAEQEPGWWVASGALLR